jgi:PAS domain S-box-containing protein
MKWKFKLRGYQKDLSGSENHYRYLFEQNPLPMLVYELGSLNLLAVNDAFASHYGYTKQEALALKLPDLYPEPEKKPIAELTTQLQRYAYAGEWHHRKKDGALITIEAHSHQFSYDGRMSRIAVINDVTERKHAEAELEQYRIHLEEMVRERTAELEIALERAESADRLKSAFLATMSHELRTPLNSIIGFTGILLKGFAGPLNGEQVKQLGMAKTSAMHLLDLVNDVLDISKIEAGRLVVTLKTFDFSKMLKKITSVIQPMAEKKNLKIYLHISDQVGSINSDERRVEQIILNLLNNAVKFTDQGYVKIECETDGQRVITSVRDSGIGIGKKDMDKLFKPFSQVDTGIARNHEGTGLGLSISRKLAEKLGGLITVESEPGKGSTFTVTLPI